MFRSSCCAFAWLVALCVCAMAQSDEEAKYRQLLPFIKSAGDCIVGAIPGNPAAVALARRGKWLDAASKTGDACNGSLNQLSQAHDLAFGAGTGDAFLFGPFKASLGKVLPKRVALPVPPPRSAPAPRPAPSAQASTEAEAAKMKLMQALEDKHTACIRTETASLVPYSNEGAETLANVVMAKCAHVEGEAADLAVAAFGYTRQGAKTVVASFMAGARQRVVNVIVTVRVEATKATRSAAPPDESRQTAPSERPASSRSF